MFLLSEQLHAKKKKIKNYSVCLTNDLILACCSQENKGNCLLFFCSDFNRTSGVFLFLWRLIISQYKQTISKQKNSASPCKDKPLVIPFFKKICWIGFLDDYWMNFQDIYGGWRSYASICWKAIRSLLTRLYKRL